MTHAPHIILASQSPQRSALLSQLGLPFTVDSVPMDEVIPPGLNPPEIVQQLSRQKAQNYLTVRGVPHSDCGKLLLTADTIVVHSGRVMGKPSAREQAYEYLQALSGNVHTVFTGVCIIRLNRETGMDDHEKEIVLYDAADVHMSTLSTAQINHYLDTREWEGAAGGYRIQGIGGGLIEGISGAYPTVVGLPIHRIYGIVWQIVSAT